MLNTLRSEYHKNLCNSILGYRAGSTVLSIADQHSSTSKDLATRMVTKMGHPLCIDPASGQTAGKWFSQYTMEFLESAFNRLQHLRPGSWLYSASVS